MLFHAYLPCVLNAPSLPPAILADCSVNKRKNGSSYENIDREVVLVSALTRGRLRNDYSNDYSPRFGTSKSNNTTALQKYILRLVTLPPTSMLSSRRICPILCSSWVIRRCRRVVTRPRFVHLCPQFSPKKKCVTTKPCSREEYSPGLQLGPDLGRSRPGISHHNRAVPSQYPAVHDSMLNVTALRNHYLVRAYPRRAPIIAS